MSENRGMLKTVQEREYPDPKTLPPQPSWQQPLPQLTLSELIPKQYVSLTARIVFLRTSERRDALGSKMIFSGILEDSSFKIPFVSHRITYPLIRNSVYKFHSAYIHEVEDKSLLLIATEHSKIESKNVEDYREYVWAPKIESINRPVHSISLQGVITTIHPNSGLVKRCNSCKSILYDTCPNNCTEGWGWDLRVSSRLYDGSGSIKMVLTKDIVSRVLQRNLSELILLANQVKPLHQNQFQTSVCSVRIPDSIDLKTELQSALVDLGHKNAFDLLLKEVWNTEQAAMGNSTLPTVCDKLNVMAAIHNRKLITALMRELREKDEIIEKFEERVIKIENQLGEIKKVGNGT